MAFSLPQSQPVVRSAALSIHGAAYRYADGTVALSDVRLCVHKGEHVAVLGPSGGGKTTLLGLISGRLRVCEGSISTAGRVATIHQDLRLVTQSSVLANVLHGALPRRRTFRGYTPADRTKALTLIARVGLTDKLHARVSRLSGGQRQRVAIARALMSDPEIMLADEPVASLDAATAREIMGLLDRLRLHRGLTLVTVTHDRPLAEAFADRLVDLRDGKLSDEPDAPTSRGGTGAVVVDSDHASRPRPAPPVAGASRPRTSPEGWSPSQSLLRWLPLAVILALLAWAYTASVTSLDLSARTTENLLPNLADFLRRLVPTPAQFVASPWAQITTALLETLRMALLGTTLAVLVSLPLAAAAARNLAPWWLRMPARFVLNVSRAVPSILWALLMVAALGLGPIAGVVALAAYSLGYLTKFFYESLEATDPNTLQALTELGASRTQRLVHGVLPHARATLVGHSVFMLEYNVRAAGVLGLVGAGGIGHELKLHLDYGNLHTVGTILAVLIALTLALDALSAKLRNALSKP